MAINTSSGYIGLGSRLFLNKEGTWGTRPGAVGDRGFESFNIYNQEGSRPQKVTTPIEVSQLYPSMLRRKPIKNSVSVEGSYTFSLPTEHAQPFMELITGDAGGLPVTGVPSAIADSANQDPGGGTDLDGYIRIVLNATISPTVKGKSVTIAGVETTDDLADANELALINSTHNIIEHINATDVIWIDLQMDTDEALAGTIDAFGGITVGGHTYDLQQEVKTSYEFCQTISTKQLSLYTGMMAQSATFNISPDDVANVEVSFLGQDETLYDATTTNSEVVFGTSVVGGTPITTDTDGNITAVATGYDNCTEFYPSWSAKLLIGRKNSANANYEELVDVNDTISGWGTPGAGFPSTAVPFSDLSITINNNLEFPAYLNGTKTRNQPVQTTYKEVTGSITLPYNEYTRQLVKSMFDQDSFRFDIVFELDDNDLGAGSDASKITISLPEVCIIGDSLADVPAGEMTLPINFGAYASKTVGVYDNPISDPPLSITFGDNQS